MGFLRFLYGFLRVFQNLVFWREVRIRVFTGSIYGFLRVDFRVFTSKIGFLRVVRGPRTQTTQKHASKST